MPHFFVFCLFFLAENFVAPMRLGQRTGGRRGPDATRKVGDQREPDDPTRRGSPPRRPRDDRPPGRQALVARRTFIITSNVCLKLCSLTFFCFCFLSLSLSLSFVFVFLATRAGGRQAADATSGEGRRPKESRADPPTRRAAGRKECRRGPTRRGR